jgi:hypothetical protein
MSFAAAPKKNRLKKLTKKTDIDQEEDYAQSNQENIDSNSKPSIFLQKIYISRES